MAERYKRGTPTGAGRGAHPRLKREMSRHEREAHNAAERAANAEVLLPTDAGLLEAEGMERTYKFTQAAIRESVDMAAARKGFDLALDQFGPYRTNVTRNGRHLLLGGRKGHLASFDTASHQLGFELHVKETVRDVQYGSRLFRPARLVLTPFTLAGFITRVSLRRRRKSMFIYMIGRAPRFIG